MDFGLEVINAIYKKQRDFFKLHDCVPEMELVLNGEGEPLLKSSKHYYNSGDLREPENRTFFGCKISYNYFQHERFQLKLITKTSDWRTMPEIK